MTSPVYCLLVHEGATKSTAHTHTRLIDLHSWCGNKDWLIEDSTGNIFLTYTPDQNNLYQSEWRQYNNSLFIVLDFLINPLVFCLLVKNYLKCFENQIKHNFEATLCHEVWHCLGELLGLVVKVLQRKDGWQEKISSDGQKKLNVN